MTYESILQALGDPTRREIFDRLRASPSAVGVLAQAMPVSQPAVSQHLRVLKEAGLVEASAEGRRRIYRARLDGLAPLRSYLKGMWSDALGAFSAAAEARAATRD